MDILYLHPSSPTRHRILAIAIFCLLPIFAHAAPAASKNDTAKARLRSSFLAVLPLAAQGVNATSAKVLTDALADEILRLKKVRVMERAQMETILKEQGFQQSGACDGSECAVQVGKLLGIDLMVVGSLGKIGNTYTLSVRAVNVGTGEVVASARRSVRGEIDILLTEMVPLLARELVSGVTGGSVEPTAATAIAIPTKTFIDPRDDQRYDYVRIGDKNWMTRNMNYHVSDYSSWCFDGSKGNCDFLGHLYTWDRATIACPKGWNLPTDREWDELVANLGGPEKAGSLMRPTKGSKDNSVFRARAGGFRDPDGGYLGIGTFALWWTATESDTTSAYSRSLDFSGTSVGGDAALKSNGYSVRCVQPAK